MIRRASVFNFLICFISIPGLANAGDKLDLPNIFGDSMVLQADKPVSVWGWAEKGTTIEVTFGESAVQTKEDENGKWKTQFPTMPKCLQPRSLIIHSDKQRLEFKDVLVGEVWLCGAQSN
ncbi:MAG: 9-O-acetylesterase, partial [Pirellulales bacterium]|nr:9-O-acetylesterase [Pirellulales bacterium]